MKASTILRCAVILEWILIIFGIVLSFIMESFLPAELQAWLQNQADSDFILSDLLLIFLGVPLLISHLAASIGLILLHRWGAWLYVATTLLVLALYLFTGPTVEHALDSAIDDAATILSGLIIGIAFFSDALKKKEQPIEAATSE